MNNDPVTRASVEPRPVPAPYPRLERDVTLALLAVNLFVFLIEPSMHSPMRHWFEERYSLWLPGLKRGYWWQFITYQFLHGGWFHLGANLIFLHSLGPILETTMGRRRFLLLYLGSGAMGGLLQLAGALSSPRIFGQSAVMGASAGLAGLLAALGSVYANETIRVYLFFVLPFELKAKYLLLVAGLVSVAGSLFPFGNIAHLAHLGGLLGGLCWVNLLNVRPLPELESGPPPPVPAAGTG